MTALFFLVLVFFKFIVEFNNNEMKAFTRIVKLVDPENNKYKGDVGML